MEILKGIPRKFSAEISGETPRGIPGKYQIPNGNPEKFQEELLKKFLKMFLEKSLEEYFKRMGIFSNGSYKHFAGGISQNCLNEFL